MRERSYQKLIVWREAHTLCLKIFTILKTWDLRMQWNLLSQIQRSAYGVPMNIAEGNIRRSLKEKRHFLVIADASLEELHYQLLLSKDLGWISELQWKEVDDGIQRTGYLLSKFKSSLS